uniref:Uncharacterized protein n=1 Tax=Peronospora matthiolae TaxID=2874970 RepID=A0AAV1TCL9_9STRA
MTAPRRALKLSTLALTSDTNDFCSSVTSCLKDGSSTCDTTTRGGDCPPCIYVLDNTFTCWEKDNATNTCPFTGVRYDCSDSWSSMTIIPSTSTSSSSSRASPPGELLDYPTPSSSLVSPDTKAESVNATSIGGLSFDVVTYGAIGLAALLVFLLLLVLCARRRKMRRHREENVTITGAGGNFSHGISVVTDKRPRGLSKLRDDGYTSSYNNVLDTNKVSYTRPDVSSSGSNDDVRKNSPLGRVNGLLPRLPLNESPRSMDGMLTDSPHSPPVLGGKSSSYKGSGRSNLPPAVAAGMSGFSNVSDYVQQDVSSRCTSTPNVFAEYLRMKEEMQYDDECVSSVVDGLSAVSFSDTISDLDSGKYSFASSHDVSRPPKRRTDVDGRSSVSDSIADSIADSVTDSEYAEQIRARGGSECDSEMSYNDEKYSFSSLDGLDDSQVRVGKREVEI